MFKMSFFFYGTPCIMLRNYYILVYNNNSDIADYMKIDLSFGNDKC